MSDDLRQAAFAIAYRMLGSVSEAEDVVQEALIRLQAAEEREPIGSRRAYLATITTRLAIDELRSARARRERYVGAWLPEPLLTDERDPEQRVELADSLSQALLVVLETLSPVERAVFLLRDVFDYEYADIAEIVERSEANCRQLAHRARAHVDERRPRFEHSRAEEEELAERFFAAVEAGELAPLEELLAADVVAYGDGGGKVPAFPKPIHGPAQVAKLLISFAKQVPRMGLRMRRVDVNGRPGAMFFDPDGRLVSVLSLDYGGGVIQTVRSHVNPEKIGHLGEVADVRALLRRRSG